MLITLKVLRGRVHHGVIIFEGKAIKVNPGVEVQLISSLPLELLLPLDLLQVLLGQGPTGPHVDPVLQGLVVVFTGS